MPAPHGLEISVVPTEAALAVLLQEMDDYPEDFFEIFTFCAGSQFYRALSSRKNVRFTVEVNARFANSTRKLPGVDRDDPVTQKIRFTNNHAKGWRRYKVVGGAEITQAFCLGSSNYPNAYEEDGVTRRKTLLDTNLRFDSREPVGAAKLNTLFEQLRTTSKPPEIHQECERVLDGIGQQTGWTPISVEVEDLKVLFDEANEAAEHGGRETAINALSGALGKLNTCRLRVQAPKLASSQTAPDLETVPGLQGAVEQARTRHAELVEERAAAGLEHEQWMEPRLDKACKDAGTALMALVAGQPLADIDLRALATRQAAVKAGCDDEGGTQNKRKQPCSKADAAKGDWSEEERECFVRGFQKCGSGWSDIARGFVHTRTVLQIKNFAAKYMKKRAKLQTGST